MALRHRRLSDLVWEEALVTDGRNVRNIVEQAAHTKGSMTNQQIITK
jgi:hypothetical protein